MRRCFWTTIACVALSVASLDAQTRIQLPQTPPAGAGTSPVYGATPWNGGTTPAPFGQPGVGAAPTAGSGGFDPYATGTAADTAPSLMGGTTWPGGSAGAGAGLGAPVTTPPPAPAFGNWGTPTPFPAGSPPSLYPQGLYAWTPQAAMGAWAGPPLRFLQPRARYTYVYGENNPDDLEIHDIDASVVAAFPNFLWTGQPLYVAPSFGLDLWSGPRPPTPADLPSRAYEAYLDAGWTSDPSRPIGGEVGARFGAFTDFNTFNKHSLRYQGRALLRLQLTPTVAVRGGVIYVDRNDIKLIPAGGVLWTPNPYTRFDIYFPNPKFSKYLTTTGNYDVYWYLAGEYGGGSWTIERANNTSDRIDLNDIRLIGGFEWGQQSLMRRGQRIGFIEAGWVTRRELIYVVRPQDSIDLRDTFMVRAGIGY